MTVEPLERYTARKTGWKQRPKTGERKLQALCKLLHRWSSRFPAVAIRMIFITSKMFAPRRFFEDALNLPKVEPAVIEAVANLWQTALRKPPVQTGPRL